MFEGIPNKTGNTRVMFARSLKVAVTPDFTRESVCAKKLRSIKKMYPFSLKPNLQDRKDLKEFLFYNAMRIVTNEIQQKM
jgi:hypothetical protein